METILARDLVPGLYASYGNRHIDFFLHNVEFCDDGLTVILDFTFLGRRRKQHTLMQREWHLTAARFLDTYVIDELGVLL